MKRFMLLALTAIFALGMIGTASAVELKVSGEWKFTYQWSDSLDFDTDSDSAGDDTFYANQRARLYFNYVASENLSGTLGLEIGDDVWGDASGHARHGADDKDIEVKHSYITFVYPNTDLLFKVGVQNIALPSAVAGNPVYDKDVAGILASYKVNDMFSVAAAWARVNDTVDVHVQDEIDALALILPISLDGAALTPWLFYAMAGEDAGDFDALWLGLAGELSFMDPFFLNFDLIYGNLEADAAAADASGFFFDAALGYKMDMMTPQLIFLYSTGDDDDAADGAEAMPTIAGTWGPTSLGTDGTGTLGNGCLLTCDGITGAGSGYLAVGLVLGGMSFIDGVSHDFRAVYYTGTSDEDNGGFTEDDSAWELNFDTNYKIYENLSALLELAYIQVDMDDADVMEDPAMVMRFNLKYKF